MGQIAENEADYQSAVNYYHQALALFPNNYQLDFRLAKTQLQLGNKVAALNAYRTGTRLNPAYMKDKLKLEGLSERDFTW